MQATSTGKSEELCNLRLVSKRFDNLISPLLFSTIRLEFRDADCRRSTAPDHTRCQEIIQALATRSTTVFDHTKKLYFSLGGLHSTNSEDVSAARTSLSDEIFNAICGLKNLRTIQSVRAANKIPNTHPRSTLIAAFSTRGLTRKNSQSRLFAPWAHSPRFRALNISVSAPHFTLLSQPLHSNLSRTLPSSE